MNRIYGLALSLLLMVVMHQSSAQPAFQSSFQPGEQIDSEFKPLNVTGKFAGKEHCLLCENGTGPGVMIFARGVSEPLVKLLDQIDAATGKNQDRRMCSFVVFLSKDAGLAQQLKQVAAKHQFKHVVLSTFDAAGPEGFKVNKDADVTVVLYHGFIVAANHAFRKDGLTDDAGTKVIADLPKILSKK